MHFLANFLETKMRIGIERYPNIRMPHNVLQRLRVHACRCHSAAKGMAADMGRYLWHLHFIYFIVFGTDMPQNQCPPSSARQIPKFEALC